MTEQTQPRPKDFKVFIAYDEEVSKYYVTETEFAGLILEDADAGRLISRLCVAAVDLLEFTTEKGWNQFDLAPGQSARFIPVFHAPVAIDWQPL
jgi:hypothetical protein